MLAICGGYQLLGHYFLTHTNEQLPGVGILDVHTVAGKQRMIGNIVIETQLSTQPAPVRLVGFENHSGRTYHGSGVQSLGRVLKGYGDNGSDNKGGAVYRNVFGCYLHGSLLPKNPHSRTTCCTLPSPAATEPPAPPNCSHHWMMHWNETPNKQCCKDWYNERERLKRIDRTTTHAHTNHQQYPAQCG